MLRFYTILQGQASVCPCVLETLMSCVICQVSLTPTVSATDPPPAIGKPSIEKCASFCTLSSQTLALGRFFLAALRCSRSLVVVWSISLLLGRSVVTVCEKVTFRVSDGY